MTVSSSGSLRLASELAARSPSLESRSELASLASESLVDSASSSCLRARIARLPTSAVSTLGRGARPRSVVASADGRVALVKTIQSLHSTS